MTEQEQEITGSLNIPPEWVCSEWIENYYNLLKELCELEENRYFGTDLDWFVYDIDFGRAEGCHVYDGDRLWTISSPEILYDFIMRDEY